MILILFLLSIFFLFKPASVEGFTHQFILKDNIINFDFSKIETIATSSSKSSATRNVLSFEFRIQAQEDLPTDIPLFIVAFNQEAVFYVDASAIDANFHKVEIDLKDFTSTYANQWPIFYKNNAIEDLNLEVINVSFIDSLTQNKSSGKIDDLNVIKEHDGSLTVIFSVQETSKNLHSYELFCLNQKQEIINSVKLNQKDNFLWPGYSFIKLTANQKNELIFHLTEFNCESDLYVIGDDDFVSNKTSMIEVENL